MSNWMRSIGGWAPLLFLMLLLSACAAAPLSPVAAAPLSPVVTAPLSAPDQQAIADTLDALHERAAAADFDGYFALFADNAVFLGTDRSEYWPLAEFKAYTKERFATGTGWRYVASERIVHGQGAVAWFEERLQHQRFGEFRGTGVLRRQGKRWRIAQYNLTLPIPNDLFEDFANKTLDFYRAD